MSSDIIKPKRSRVVDEVFDNNAIDPDSIPNLSKEAKKLLRSKKDIRLFNQRGRKDFVNKYDIQNITYKDTDILLQFVNSIGGILSSRITKTDRIHQKAISKSIKRAREMALIPFQNQDSAGSFFM